MKKFILAAIAVVASTSVFAQETPEKGSISTEIQFNPFATNFNTFRLNGAKFKGTYFLSETDGIRFGIGFNVNKNTTRVAMPIPQSEDYSDVKLYDADMEVYDVKKQDFKNTRNSSFNLSVGYEKHFNVADRLDLYAGAEVAFGLTGKKTYTEKNNITGMNSSAPYVKGTYLDTQTDKSKTTYFGAGIFTGVNYYLYKSLYIGAELGLNLGYDCQGNEHSEWTTANPDATKKEGKAESDVKNNTLSTAIYCEPALHLGWTF